MTAAPTIQSALQLAQQQLALISETARLDAEILLTETLNCTRSHLRAWPEHKLTIDQYDIFLKLLAKRAHGEPIAHITGHRDFWDMTLRVTPDTLIPRPETETLVEQALKRIPTDARWKIADLGTGSGAIALAIARERPLCQLVATDVCPRALGVAKNNAANLQVSNITFVSGIWLTPLAGQLFDMVVSNPPYIHPEDSHLQRGDLRFEPLTALQSGTDGLADIRTICTTARQHLRPSGWLLLEHGYNQGQAVRTCLTELGYRQVQTIVDLAHNERVSLGCLRQ